MIDLTVGVPARTRTRDFKCSTSQRTFSTQQGKRVHHGKTYTSKTNQRTSLVKVRTMVMPRESQVQERRDNPPEVGLARKWKVQIHSGDPACQAGRCSSSEDNREGTCSGTTWPEGGSRRTML